MQKRSYKTTINCGGCIGVITPHLDAINEIAEWTVDTEHENKILEVKGNNLDAANIEKIVADAGFEIEPIL